MNVCIHAQDLIVRSSFLGCVSRSSSTSNFPYLRGQAGAPDDLRVYGADIRLRVGRRAGKSGCPGVPPRRGRLQLTGGRESPSLANCSNTTIYRPHDEPMLAVTTVIYLPDIWSTIGHCIALNSRGTFRLFYPPAGGL